MKKNYIAPLCEDVKMDTLMQATILEIATTSGGQVETVAGKTGA